MSHPTLEPTYEGLKQNAIPVPILVTASLEPTYEGLKHWVSSAPRNHRVRLLWSLPMRD